MSEHRSTEALLADAEERLRLTADLPARLGQTRGSAVNDAGTVRVAVTVHGALAELAISAAALAMGPQQLGEEIVRLAGEANAVALREGVGLLSRVVGDGGTTELARAVGLEHLITDAPVIPYVPGTDPNAARYLPPARGTATNRSADAVPRDRAPAEPRTGLAATGLPATGPVDDDPHSFDFSTLRSDR